MEVFRPLAEFVICEDKRLSQCRISGVRDRSDGREVIQGSNSLLFNCKSLYDLVAIDTVFPLSSPLEGLSVPPFRYGVWVARFGCPSFDRCRLLLHLAPIPTQGLFGAVPAKCASFRPRQYFLAQPYRRIAYWLRNPKLSVFGTRTQRRRFFDSSQKRSKRELKLR